MSLHKLLFFSIIMLTTFTACNRPKTAIEAVLAQAGNNRKELKKVITHYKESGDSLKLKAALYLIENMQFGYSYTGKEIAAYDKVFEKICGLQTYPAIGVAFKEFKDNYGGVLVAENLEVIKDAKQVTAAFLIKNIDLAFEAWRTNPWSKGIDFDGFCKGILPYRVGNEPLEDWRPMFLQHFNWLPDSLKGATDMRRVFGLINAHVAPDYQMSTRWHYPFLPKYSHTIDCKVGTCDIMSSVIISALRAHGIPAYRDMIPMWGNKNYGHAWAVALDKDGKSYWCYGDRDSLASLQGLIPSSRFTLDSIGTKYLPTDVMFDTLKTIPKVYRQLTYSDPELDTFLQDEHADEIIKMFQNPRFKDVTNHYLKDCKDITIQFENIPAGVHFAYLGVFNKLEWMPVAIAKIEGKQAMFKNMGQNMLYLPMAIVNKKTIPLANLFHLKHGQQQEINPDVMNPQTVNILRKSVLFAYTINHFNKMVRGRFEGANKADFSDAKTLHIIKSAPVYMDSIEFAAPHPYRYVRYVGASDRPSGADIAELELFTLEAGQGKQLKGRVFGTPPMKGVNLEVLTDGDWDSYYASTQTKNAWIGIDLGTPQPIHKIRFCPRNDTNIIIPGKTYLLSYWDKKWVKLDSKIAADRFITFDNVPAGALLWLRCVSGGLEENPFIIKDGKQVFL